METEKFEKGTQLAKDVGGLITRDTSPAENGESPEKQATEEIEGKAKKIVGIAAREGKNAIESLIKDKLNAPPAGATPENSLPQKSTESTSVPLEQKLNDKSEQAASGKNSEHNITAAETDDKPQHIKPFKENTIDTADVDLTTPNDLGVELNSLSDSPLLSIDESPELSIADDSLKIYEDNATNTESDSGEASVGSYPTSPQNSESANQETSETDIADTYADDNYYTYSEAAEQPRYSCIRPFNVNDPQKDAGKNDLKSQKNPFDEVWNDRDVTTPEADSSLAIHDADGAALQTADSANAALSTADNAALSAGNTALQTAETGAQMAETGAQIAETGEVIAETGAEAAGGAASAGVTVAVSAAKKIGEKIKDAIVESTKTIKSESKQGVGAFGAFLFLPLMLVLSICGLDFGFGSASNVDLSENVIALMPKIQTACIAHNIPEYVPLVAAVMMQESRGDVEWVHGDVMQCAESMGYPAGTPVPVDESIDHGTGLIANLLNQVGCKSPADLNSIKLALQSYNFGPGFISWAQERGGYSKQNAIDFAAYMAAQMGWSDYGDSEYVDHVLRFYTISSASTNLGDISLIADGAFAYPLPGYSWTTYAGHEGIDIPIAERTPIYSASSGVVTYVQNAWTPSSGYTGLASYGNCIFIDYNSEWQARYAHLDCVVVANGSYVEQGQLIGFSGDTGNSTGPHLHLALYYHGSPRSDGVIYAEQAWPHLR